MRRLFFGIILLGSLAPVALAQFTATLTVNNFTQSGGNYSFDIWARRTGASAIFVGNSSFYFTYNASGLGSPSLSNVNSRYTGDGVTTNYGPMGVELVSEEIAVTVVYTGAMGGSSALSTDAPDGERMCTVTLPITDPGQTASLAWDDINSSLTTTGAVQIGQTFVGSDNSPLPIQLASFTASIQQESGSVLLKWSTASETNNYGFIVQRKPASELQYADLASSFIPGHGTTVEPQAYSYMDNSVGDGTYDYRLKQQDMDGTVHYSQSVRVTTILADVTESAPKVFQLNQNYPNPFNPSTMIRFSVETSAVTTLTMYNSLGQEVATLFEGPAEAGRYYQVMLDGRDLASGVYLYRLTSGKHSDIKRLVLVK